MISIDEAIAIIRENIPSPFQEECSLHQAGGKYLAEEIRAPEPSPRFNNSAMDGFAVRWKDVGAAIEARPVQLKISGESRAGAPFADSVGPGRAVRINTGASLPDGADTVIRVEDTAEEGGSVWILRAGRRGQDVRRQGEEFGEGGLLLAPAIRLGPPALALLASVGMERIQVYRSPKCDLFVTGSELVTTGKAIREGQIRDSNTILLGRGVIDAGGSIGSRRRVKDSLSATQKALADSDADIILCSGGVSVGRHDHVKEAAERSGFRQLFWRVRQKPGKPLFFARKENRLLFGLPGNPVSAWMCFVHYIRPLIAALQGQPFGWPRISARVAREIANPGKRAILLRVALSGDDLQGFDASAVEKQGSHMITSLVEADGYVILPPGQILPAGNGAVVYRF